jgi:hypothetical protein
VITPLISSYPDPQNTSHSNSTWPTLDGTIFVWPYSKSDKLAGMQTLSKHDYYLLHWADADMTYWEFQTSIPLISRSSLKPVRKRKIAVAKRMRRSG